MDLGWARRAGRRALAAGALALVVVASTGVADAVRADDTPGTRPPTLMVVGDSISAKARYYGDGDPTNGRVEAWWQHVADDASAQGVPVARVVVDAQPGSGILVRGVATGASSQCTGQNFHQRLANVLTARPDVLVVAGGRNDYLYCRGGKAVAASASRRATAIDTYFADLASTAAQAGLDPSDVYVTSPWGPDKATHRGEIEPLLEAAAVREGFHWVMLPVTPSADTVDGTHPTAAGTAWIAAHVEAASDLLARLESGGTSGADVASGSTTLCAASACATQGRSDHGFATRAAETFWGQPAGLSGTGYVAYRLTHDGRATAYPAGATRDAGTWAQAAHAAGATLASRPRVGDVAWWPQGVGPAQLAVVEQVLPDAVVVSQADGSAVQWRQVSDAAYPRAFLRFPKASGTPGGVLRSVSQKSAHTLDVRGYASDPDAYDTGTTLRVVVTQQGHRHVRTLAAPTRFAFHRPVHVAALRKGSAKVAVYALNAPGSAGAASTLLGTGKVTVR